MPTTSGAVFLVGYRATGKTTVGELLALRLGLPFIDTDRDIESSLGMSIAECFAVHGEPHFREQERACLERVAARIAGGEACVVATGGGIVLDAENVRLMRERGRVVWLRARAETIRRRLEADAATATSRPALSGGSAVAEVEDVLRRRCPLYRGAAHLEVETDGARAPEGVADRIVELLSGGGATGRSGSHAG